MADKYKYYEAHDDEGKTVGTGAPSKEEMEKRTANMSPFAKAVFKDKLGGYTESYGGGQPIPKGQKWKNNPDAERAMQPRKEDGTFTYNSANAQRLSDSRSRGYTEPPFLLGSNSKIIEVGSVLKLEDGRYIISTIELTAEELYSACKKYYDDFGFDFEKLNSEGAFIGRQGRPTKEEQKTDYGILGKKDELTEREEARSEKAREKAGLPNPDKVPVTPGGQNANDIRKSMGLEPYKDFDTSKDAKTLYKENKDLIKEYVETTNKKNPDNKTTVDKVMTAIMSGKIKNPADLIY